MKGIVLNRPVDDFSGLNSWLTEWSKDTQVAISSIWMLSNRDSYIFTNFKYLIQEQCFDIKQFDKELVKWLKRGNHNANSLLEVYSLLTLDYFDKLPKTISYVLNNYKMQIYFIFNSYATYIKHHYNYEEFLTYKRQDIYETFLRFLQVCVRKNIHRDLARKILTEQFIKLSPTEQQIYFVEVYFNYETYKWKYETDDWLETYSEYIKQFVGKESYKYIIIDRILKQYFCTDYIFHTETDEQFSEIQVKANSFLLDRCLPIIFY